MPVLNALTTPQCESIAQERELAPGLVIISPICKPGASDLWFKPVDQRSDMTLNPSIAYTDITTQASATPEKLEQGKMLQLDISIGARSMTPETVSLYTGSDVITDGTTPTVKKVDIVDRPGSKPDFFQVAVFPWDGDGPDLSMGWILWYSLVLADNTSVLFSPTQPQDTQFSFYGQIHPTLQSRGQFLFSEDGADVPDLVSIASEYTAAN